MHSLSNLISRIIFLDVAFGPSFSMGEIDSTTKIIVIVVLLAFLGFIGYLILNSIKKK